VVEDRLGHIVIVPAHEGPRLETIRELFLEYAESLEIDLGFQDFGRELAGLPGDYAAPDGCLLLAVGGGEPAGCVALRRVDATTCEMKRMYVRPACRGSGLGRALGLAVMDEGRRREYTAMRLDTLPTMHAAIALYRSIGFEPIDPYRFNPIPGAMFMEADLTSLRSRTDGRPPAP